MVHHEASGGRHLTTVPADDDAAALERGRLLFAQECRFVAGAASLQQLPSPDRPEVAFAGRSNVGKSSLINALTGRKALARTSHTPGRTQQINFFDLGGRLSLVDLPGYGYARASKKDVKTWTRLVRDYLRGRPNLTRLCLLVDARHGLKDSDREIMAMLDEAGVVYQLVLTKADKPRPAELAERCAAVEIEARGHPAAYPTILVTSAQAGTGIAALRAAVAALAAP